MTGITLTKKTMALLMRDDAKGLLALLPEGSSATRAELQGEPLIIKCAEAGAMSCFEALLDREPQNAGALLRERDGTAARALDLAAFYMNAPLAKKCLALSQPDGALDSDPLGDSGLLLTRALKGARWDAALVWLEAYPAMAQTITPYGRSTLHLVAERSFEHQNAFPDALWPEPPASLTQALLARGANASWLSPKGYSALSRSLVQQTRATIATLLEWQKNGEPKAPMSRNEPLYKANFAPLHEAVWMNDASSLEALIALGGDIEEPTAMGSSPLRLAVRRDAFDCAQVLINRGASLDDQNDRAGPLSIAALYSRSPMAWIDWLTERGVNVFGRDETGTSFTEMSMERLPLAQAKIIWNMSPESDRARDPGSLLGAFERAARSPIDPVEKMSFLLEQGLLPARVNSGEDWKSVLGRRFELGSGRRSAQLGALWHTSESDPNMAAPAPEGDGEEEEEDFTGLPLKAKSSNQRSAVSRPSLLGYLAARSCSDALRFLLDWDKKTAHFREADYVMAWREGLRSDAPLGLMKTLAAALNERSLPLWGEAENTLAQRHFGPQKGKSLGFLALSSGAYLQKQIACANANALAVAFMQDGAKVSYTALNDAPWRTAANSAHPGAIKLCLPEGDSWPATSCAWSALAIAEQRKCEPTLSWIIDSLSARAHNAAPDSPWGANPASALALWSEQAQWEHLQAVDQFNQTAAPGSKIKQPEAGVAGSSFIEKLLRALINQDHFASATRLISMGLPAPSSLIDSLSLFCNKTIRHSGLGGDPGKLSALRELAEAIAGREDYRGLIGATEIPSEQTEGVLARSPDPVIFQTFLQAGAPVGDSAHSAFSKLARAYASRLSPAFAQRLADWAQSAHPEGGSLDVAASLASMPKHRSISAISDSSPTATQRALRAASEASDEDWEQAHRRDGCPIEAALGAGNISIALKLMEIAPEMYRQDHCAQWAPRWLVGRARHLTEALAESDRDEDIFNFFSSASAETGAAAESEEPDGSPQARKARERALNLARIESELADITAVGGSLGINPREDTAAAAAIASTMSYGTGRASALMWALSRGLRPSSLIEVTDLPYQARHLFPRDSEAKRWIPAAAAFFDHNAQESGRLYVLWSTLGLPTDIVISRPAPLPDIDNPGQTIALEEPDESEPRVLMDLLTPKARAVAEELLIELELRGGIGAPSPASSPRSPRRGL